MKRPNVSRVQFLVVSCLCLTSSLSLAQMTDLQREQGRLYTVIHELTGVYEENHNLAVQLEQFNEQVNRLQKDNEALEELVFGRAQTYLAVTDDLSDGRSNDLFLSRSGYGESRYYPGAVNLPVRSASGLTGDDFERVWRVYRAHNLTGTGEALVRAEKEYGVSALVLAAIVVHESGWGRSAIARNKNNLAGLGAYDGSEYSSAMTFASREDSIVFLAKLLSDHYLNPAGRHYHGPDLAGIGRAYASDPHWAVKVAGKMKQIVGAAVENPEAIVAYTRWKTTRQ